MNNSASFGYEQYAQWAEESKTAPLPRKQIKLGDKEIEVFALPGYKDYPGRYIYSGESATAVAQKHRNSMLQFLRSKSPFALPHKGFECYTFVIENYNAGIIGYPAQVVFDYWLYQLSKGNLAVSSIISALGSTSLDLLADSQFGINRAVSEYERLIQNRLFTKEAVEYKTHFFPAYYSELYRIFQIKPTGKGKPGVFAQITRECFYSLFPGQANDIFDERNPDRAFYHHQFLTDDGNKVFNQIMTSFLTFLRGCPCGKLTSFLVQYQNVYGSGFQGTLDLD